MVGRRRLLSAVAAVAAVAALAACGEPLVAQRRPRVGFLGEIDETFEAFRGGLRDLGYSDGQNVLVLPRQVSDDLDETVRALVAMPVDVIVAGNNALAFAAKRATSTVPIVMARAQDSVEVGLVASLAQPGGNLTGIAVPYAGLTVKRLDLLHEAFPNVRKPILGYSGGEARPADANAAERTIEAGRRLGMEVLTVSGGRSDAEWLAKLSDAAASGGDALVLMHVIGVVLASACRRIAGERRMPSIWASAREADEGGLMAYAFDQPAAFRRAASFVDRILKGAKPADLPLEQPTTYDFVINLVAARSLGLTIPDAVLRRSTRIIR